MTANPDRKSLDKTIVMDTNVLLADPNSLLSFPRAEVVIPETVLGELDKLKTARVDPDLRFRGREVSRILFELSDEGSLVDGVELPDGGFLRVAPYDDKNDMPEGLSGRNADDRILATAYQVTRAAGEGADVTLVTNDLNMLLKAQTLHIPVNRYGEGVEGGFARRYIIRPFQRYKIPLAILSIALAVFAAIIVLALYLNPTNAGVTGVPTEFEELLSSQQQRALNALTALQRNPEDSEALLDMGNFYFDAMTGAQQAGDRSSELRYARRGQRYYERYLELRPDDNDARADVASLYFYAGQTDKAIQEVGRVLESNPDHINANYNLGIFYLRGRGDIKAAKDQMEKVIRLTQNEPNQHGILQQATLLLKQIDEQSGGSKDNTGVTQ